MTAEELDMKFARLIRRGRQDVRSRIVNAERRLAELEDLWASVLEHQGRTEADLSGRVQELLKVDPFRKAPLR